MYDGSILTPELAEEFRKHGIDGALTFHILEGYNAGRYAGVEPIHVSALPKSDGSLIVDLTGPVLWEMPLAEAQAALERHGLAIDLNRIGRVVHRKISFDRPALERIGIALFPKAAYGVLNGGSATSYVDLTKNRAFSEAILEICRTPFETVAAMATGRAKGITPAFVQPDGSPGPSYMELKLRALLLQALRYMEVSDSARSARPGDGGPAPLSPMFQMTSISNDAELRSTVEGYRESPMLAPLIERTALDITRIETGVQSLIAAYTHSDEGAPKRVFTRANGREGAVLPLPGGHGQNFRVLAEVYRGLYRKGKRFVQLGNVDNLGNTIDPVELALLALSGRKAGFDFSYKTPVDVKGGILVIDQHGRPACADIGPAISRAEVEKAEQGGTPILFNCATGLFDLAYLVDRLEEIQEGLPMRFSDQNKDAGRYSQAEQVTWEIVGMLDDFFVFGVDKYERFLAAKLLLECLMTSGVGLDDPRYPEDRDPSKNLKAVATRLHRGLASRLESVYGMILDGKRWRPKSIDELRQ